MRLHKWKSQGNEGAKHTTNSHKKPHDSPMRSGTPGNKRKYYHMTTQAFRE